MVVATGCAAGQKSDRGAHPAQATERGAAEGEPVCEFIAPPTGQRGQSADDIGPESEGQQERGQIFHGGSAKTAIGERRHRDPPRCLQIGHHTVSESRRETFMSSRDRLGSGSRAGPTPRWWWKFRAGLKQAIFWREFRAPARAPRRCGHKHFRGRDGPESRRDPWRTEVECEGRSESSVFPWREAFRKGLPER